MPRKRSWISPITARITKKVPSDFQLIVAPRNESVASGNSHGSRRLLYDQIQPARPVSRVSRPTVTTIAVSGSPFSNLRMSRRSMSAPMMKAAITASRMPTISGIPQPTKA